jgi:hypothetical protein
MTHPNDAHSDDLTDEQYDDIEQKLNDEDYPEDFSAFRQAEAAASRGDIDTTERWTRLMERQCAALERVVEAMCKLDFEDLALLMGADRLPNRAAMRAAKRGYRKVRR